MSLDAVPPTETAPGMVAEAVGHPVTERACRVRRGDWQAQAKLDHDPEKPRHHVQAEGLTLGRVTMHRPQAAEAVGSEPCWLHVLGLACHSMVKCRGQLPLSGGKRHRALQVVGGQDHLIVGSNCSEEGRVVGKVIGAQCTTRRCLQGRRCMQPARAGTPNAAPNSQQRWQACTASTLRRRAGRCTCARGTHGRHCRKQRAHGCGGSAA